MLLRHSEPEFGVFSAEKAEELAEKVAAEKQGWFSIPGLVSGVVLRALQKETTRITRCREARVIQEREPYYDTDEFRADVKHILLDYTEANERRFPVTVSLRGQLCAAVGGTTHRSEVNAYKPHTMIPRHPDAFPSDAIVQLSLAVVQARDFHIYPSNTHGETITLPMKPGDAVGLLPVADNGGGYTSVDHSASNPGPGMHFSQVVYISSAETSAG